jgi:hypothetical protein
VLLHAAGCLFAKTSIFKPPKLGHIHAAANNNEMEPQQSVCIGLHGKVRFPIYPDAFSRPAAPPDAGDYR